MSERTGAVVMSSRPSASRRNQLTRRTSLAAIDRGRCIPVHGRNDGRSSTPYEAALARWCTTGRSPIVHDDREDDDLPQLTAHARALLLTEAEAS